MKFYVYKNSGFCSGVQSAINKALATKGEVYCLGQLVHNKAVTDMLTQHGIVTVDNLEQVPNNSTIIISAHGTNPETIEKCKAKNLIIIDTTCPYVQTIQKRAKKYYELGYQIVLVGDLNHKEIIGINGWCNNTAIITDGEQKICVEGAEKVLIMFQTTYDCEKYAKSIENITVQGAKTVDIFNTICYTTIDRQNYAHFVAKISDFIVVVGDRNSSNTNKLYNIAKRYTDNILWIDSENVPKIDLSKYKNIGFITGASTPVELVKGVLERMSESAKENVEVVEVAENNGQLLFEQEVDNIVKLNKGQVVDVKVSAIEEDGVLVRIPNWKQDANIDNEELAMEDWETFKSTLKVDDTLTCRIKSIEKGKVTLSKREIDERKIVDAKIDEIKDGAPFDVVITKKSTNCVIGRMGSYTVIIPASQIKLGFVKDLDKYVGQTLTVVTSEDKIDSAKHTIKASRKSILLAEKQEKEDAFWNNIEVNEIVEGKVVRFADFGAFVNVRGFDCLAHSSDLSWERVNSPKDILEIGETYEFVVLQLDREKNRVSLGYKQLQARPWDMAAEKYPVGTVTKGKVARIMPFGAFVQLEGNIDGLLHISNVSWDWIDDINKAVKVGDEIEVKVMEFDADTKRITLSSKALMPEPEQSADTELVASTEDRD